MLLISFANIKETNYEMARRKICLLLSNLYSQHQFEDKKDETALLSKGIPKERIHKYGFAFRGKEVLIGEG